MLSNKRLLIFSSEFPPGPGGIGTHAYQLALHLSQIGWKVNVVTPQHYAAGSEIEDFNHHLPFVLTPLQSFPRFPHTLLHRRKVLTEQIQHGGFDLLVATGDRSIYLAALLTRRYQLSWVAIEHGRAPRYWERMVKRWALQQASAVICVSNYTAQRMAAMGVRPQRSRTIHNGAEAARFCVLPSTAIENFRTKLKIDAEASILLTVGHVSERKGQDIVIQALPHILVRRPNTHYLMVGLPAKQQEFEQLANTLHVADQVHFMGKVDTDELVYFLNICDIFVMTSRHAANQFEGFGIAVIEAALCGKPAVVTQNSGLVEAIVEGETGISVPTESPEKTAEAILTLLENPRLCRQMGTAAQKRAIQTHTWEKKISEYNDLFLQLIEEQTTL